MRKAMEMEKANKFCCLKKSGNTIFPGKEFIKTNGDLQMVEHSILYTNIVP